MKYRQEVVAYKLYKTGEGLKPKDSRKCNICLKIITYSETLYYLIYLCY